MYRCAVHPWTADYRMGTVLENRCQGGGRRAKTQSVQKVENIDRWRDNDRGGHGLPQTVDGERAAPVYRQRERGYLVCKVVAVCAVQFHQG